MCCHQDVCVIRRPWMKSKFLRLDRGKWKMGSLSCKKSKQTHRKPLLKVGLDFSCSFWGRVCLCMVLFPSMNMKLFFLHLADSKFTNGCITVCKDFFVIIPSLLLNKYKMSIDTAFIKRKKLIKLHSGSPSNDWTHWMHLKCKVLQALVSKQT